MYILFRVRPRFWPYGSVILCMYLSTKPKVEDPAMSKVPKKLTQRLSLLEPRDIRTSLKEDINTYHIA